MKKYIAYEHHTREWHRVNNCTKKSILELFGYNTGQKMYCDSSEGKSKQIGWVISKQGYPMLWVTVYKLEEVWE